MDSPFSCSENKYGQLNETIYVSMFSTDVDRVRIQYMLGLAVSETGISVQPRFLGPPDLIHRKEPKFTSEIVLPKMYNLNLIPRKHQTHMEVHFPK